MSDQAPGQLKAGWDDKWKAFWRLDCQIFRPYCQFFLTSTQTTTAAAYWQGTGHEERRNVSNALVRPIAISEHPLHDRRYRLPTPPIDALYALVTEALDLSLIHI